MTDNIAVTVIGGYLGAGKTTLVNHILRTADERVAVLVNDFGDIDIDADLIESRDGDTISLANGCICCSLVDGLASALSTVKGLEPRPQRLVIEASGVADPAMVAAYAHSPGLALDAVVVMADAETVRQRSTDNYVGDTVLAQLRSADIAVLNKIDLLAADQIVAVSSWLEEQCPEAVIIHAEQSQVPNTVLFGKTGERSPARSPHDSDDHCSHSEADDLFESWSWSSKEPTARPMIEALMFDLPQEIIRAKGLLWLTDEPDRSMVLQRVGQRWDLRPGKDWTADRESRLVLIGMRGAIDDDWLLTRLSGREPGQ